MPIFRERKASRAWKWIVALILTGILAGFLAWPYGKKRYHLWRAHRESEKAADFFAQHDMMHAMLTARTALTHNPVEPQATRIMAKSLDAMGSPEAEQWRARLETLLPGDTENTLARAAAALTGGDAGAAEQILNGVGLAARGSAAYHVVAARIATEKRDTASAETHWAEAVRLDPADDRHRLNLASVRLESKEQGTREAGLATLQEMRGTPSTSVEALRFLLADAVRRREAPRAREMADALVAEERCTFRDKLSRLSTLRHIHDGRSTQYLLELRDAAVSEPAELYALLTWMNANDLSLMVAEWVRRMPPEIIARPPVSISIAETYLLIREWQKLEDLVSGQKWGESDFFRRAFLSRALEGLGEEEDAMKEWTEALAAARGHSDALERLAKFARQMKWDKRGEAIMRTLAARPQSPRWVLNALWQDAFQRGETAQLQKLSATQAKADPKGIASRNNYAFLSLLTRNEEGNPHRIAETLYHEQPDNAMVASTYGLSLFQRGKAGQAVALMSALNPEDLRQPQVALYYAIFLLGAGDAEKADSYVKLSADWPMLPEEKALLERAKAAGLKIQQATETPAPATGASEAR